MASSDSDTEDDDQEIKGTEPERDELADTENNNERDRHAQIDHQEEIPGEEEIDRDEGQESETPQERENQRGPVIRHEGECCTHPRQRIPARSLPGRPIGRYETVHPSHKNTPFVDRVVKTGDVIQYFTGTYLDGQEEWIKATVQPMAKKLQLKHPEYYNIINEKGKEMSIKLQPGGCWRIL